MTCAVTLCLAAVVAAAVPAAGTPSLEELIERALVRSPELAAASARVRAAEARRVAAGSLENPMLEVMLQNEGFPDPTIGEAGMSMVGPRLTQTFPGFGVRSARREVARFESLERVAEAELRRRGVIREVRMAYAALYALDQERGALAAAQELLDLLGVAVRQRHAQGLGESQALSELALRASTLSERGEDLLAERRRVVAGLQRLCDLPQSDSFGTILSLPSPARPDSAWGAVALRASAALLVRRAATEKIAAELRLWRVEGRPDLTASAGVAFRGGMGPVVTLGIGTDLPLWNGQNRAPLVRATAEELTASREDLRDAEARVREEAQVIMAEWDRADSQLARYDTERIPATRLAFDTARAAYVNGTLEFPPLLDAFVAWLDTRATRARREAERFAAFAAFDYLTRDGADPMPRVGGE